jgi:hypothetical protein
MDTTGTGTQGSGLKGSLEDNVLGEAIDRSVAAAKSKAEQRYDEVRESARS